MVEVQDTSCHLLGSSCWVMCDHSETSLPTQMLQHLTEPVILSTRYFHEDFLQFSMQPNLYAEYCNQRKYFIVVVYPLHQTVDP